jgi:hypothetical protein
MRPRRAVARWRTRALADTRVDREVDARETSRPDARMVGFEPTVDSDGTRSPHRVKTGRKPHSIAAFVVSDGAADDTGIMREQERDVSRGLRARLLGDADGSDRTPGDDSPQTARSRVCPGPGRTGQHEREGQSAERDPHLPHGRRTKEGRPCGRPSRSIRRCRSYGVSLLIRVDQFASAERGPGPCPAPPHVPSKLSPVPPTKNGPPQAV